MKPYRIVSRENISWIYSYEDHCIHSQGPHFSVADAFATIRLWESIGRYDRPPALENDIDLGRTVPLFYAELKGIKKWLSSLLDTSN